MLPRKGNRLNAKHKDIKARRQKKIYSNIMHIEATMTISFSCKIDFETGTNTREKWGHFILMKGSIHH